jgi:uncharacterized UBP type Zn finger protein
MALIDQSVRPTRLVNFGNGCFFNSMTQFLATSDEFREKVAALDNERHSNSLATHLARTFSAMKNGNVTMNLKQLYDVTPKVPGTGPGQQGDAAEFAMYTIRALPGTETCFGVRMQSEVNCAACGNNLDIPATTCVEEFAMDFSKKTTMENFAHQIKRQDVALPGYKCDKCGTVGRCTKQSKLRRVRKCVVLNVARSENIVPIESFQLLMNVNDRAQYVTYKFAAAVKHIGTPHVGHYICIATRKGDDGHPRLFRLDDESIAPTTIKDAEGSVLLMYQAAWPKK